MVIGFHHASTKHANMFDFRTRAATAALTLASLSACGTTSIEPEPTAPLSSSVGTMGSAEAVMPGEVLVRVARGRDVAAIARARGLTVAAVGYRDAFHVLRGPTGNERALAAALATDPGVEVAEPNYLRQPTAIDSRLWAFHNPGGLNMKFTSGGAKGQFIPTSYASVADADIDLVEGSASGGGDVVIGSIDTGVQLNHAQFTGRLIAGRDWYSNDNTPSDGDGHGTHTTGTMAGSTVGVAGVAGAAAKVKVHVQRVCGPFGCPTSAIVNAINAAADVSGMVAMNLSLGGSSLSSLEQAAINYAVNTKGVLVIAAAGNSGTSTVSCPACDPNAISVAATNWQDGLAGYSQYGTGLDLAAPGGQCYSNTTPEGCIYSAYKSGTFKFLQGTSMATPMVTGLAAIVASKTGLRGSALRARLEGTADDLGSTGYDTRFGNGRINAARALAP